MKNQFQSSKINDSLVPTDFRHNYRAQMFKIKARKNFQIQIKVKQKLEENFYLVESYCFLLTIQNKIPILYSLLFQ